MTIPARPYTCAMQTYIVGGAVRDELLGRAVHDRDWVVIGATPEQLVAAGYTPVGKDFPVFLHPVTHEEVALARTERKTARGYHGFAFRADPSVTLEEDLARRDLTINAMARAEDGRLIDPYGGRRDLEARLLRHVTPAFAEDPVRILRVARFAARYDDFTVAPETLALMRQMVAHGEADALVPERVWQEIARGLMESHPERMLEVLHACGALERVLPEVDRLWGTPQPAEHHPEIDAGMHTLLAVAMGAQLQAPLTVRFACLVHDVGKGLTPAERLPRHIAHEARGARLVEGICQRLRVPTECRDLALLTTREHGNIHRSMTLSAEALLRLLERCDAFRKPERFAELLLACECDARGRAGRAETSYPQRVHLSQVLALAASANTAEVAREAMALGRRGPDIGRAIAHARLAAIIRGLEVQPGNSPHAERP